MGIEIGRLEAELLRMSAESAPGQEFCDAIAELARTGRFEQLQSVLPPVAFAEMSERYQRNPVEFASEWKSLGEEMQHGFVEHARHRLTSLTRMQHGEQGSSTEAWMQIQCALDAEENDLLRTAIALDLLELVEPAALRAAHLRECVVETASSEEADRYLDEATRCYFYGLFTACAVMCRSVLEESIRQKLPPQLSKLVVRRYKSVPTLGNLLHEVNNNLQQTGFDPDFPRLANLINDTGKKAVHQGLLSEDEARECLQNARRALEMLLKH